MTTMWAGHPFTVVADHPPRYNVVVEDVTVGTVWRHARDWYWLSAVGEGHGQELSRQKAVTHLLTYAVPLVWRQGKD